MDIKETSYKDHISRVIEQQLQQGGIQNSDFKFYNVERLIRIAPKLDAHSALCSTCRQHKKDLEELAENLHYYLNTSNKTRKAFEQKQDMLVKHLKNKHQITTAGYHLHLQTFLGIIAGLVAGYLITFAYGGEILKIGLLGGAALGLVIGRSLGLRKEMRMRRKGRIL